MPDVLVITETRRGELRPVSFELIGAALQIKQQIRGQVLVAIVDAEAATHVAALGSEGVDAVLTVTSPLPSFEGHMAQRALEVLIAQEQPALVLAAHSIDALGFVPAVAAVGGFGFASDVTSVRWDDDGPVATRGAYSGKLAAEYDFPGKTTTLLMLRTGAFSPAAEGLGGVSVREVRIDDLASASKTEHIGYRDVDEGDVDITKADFLLSIGRGVGDKENVERFASLAQKLGATLSVSRPLVDAGWLPNSRQVGQSGKVVKPRVYLAMGISGAVQHLAGMRDADTIIAVNTDRDAPIFDVAHYGAVKDMFELADELEQALS